MINLVRNWLAMAGSKGTIIAGDDILSENIGSFLYNLLLECQIGRVELADGMMVKYFMRQCANRL